MLRTILTALLTLLCGDFGEGAEPAPTPETAAQAAKATAIDHPKLDATQARACTAQIRWVARVKLWQGQLNRADFIKVQAAIDNPDATAELSEQIAYEMAAEAKAVGKKPGFDPGGFFQWILDHWPQIWAMIQALLQALSQNLPANGPTIAELDPGPTYFCSWPTIFRPQGTVCTAETCPSPSATASEPLQTQEITQAAFRPFQGPFMSRGPARRFLARLLPLRRRFSP